MNLYSHAVLARHLLPLVHPQDEADYLWGAVIPDIRYLAGMRRDTTHLPDARIAAWFERYPGCQSFIQGYRIHCLLDRIDTVQVIGSRFPLKLLRLIRRKPLRSQQAAVIIELYYFKVYPQGLSLEGRHNPILEELGVRADQSSMYASSSADYVAHPCFETAARCFNRLGIIEDARIEKYVNEYQRFNRNPVLLWAMMTSARSAGLEKLAVSMYDQLPCVKENVNGK